MYARARVRLVSWKGRSHALLFMVPLGLPSARSMSQALRLPFEYYYIQARDEMFKTRMTIVSTYCTKGQSVESS